jgi:hypothetical protein
MSPLLVALTTFAYVSVGLVLMVLQSWVRRCGSPLQLRLLAPEIWRRGEGCMEKNRQGAYDLFTDPSVLLPGMLIFMLLWPVWIVLMTISLIAGLIFGQKPA